MNEMTMERLEEIERLYRDYINYEASVHGGTHTAAKNLGCYSDGHREFQCWLADGFPELIAEIKRLRRELDEAPCWCRDCKYYYDGEVCVNADSDWRADYPPEYGSCQYCKRRGLPPETEEETP